MFLVLELKLIHLSGICDNGFFDLEKEVDDVLVLNFSVVRASAEGPCFRISNGK